MGISADFRFGPSTYRIDHRNRSINRLHARTTHEWKSLIDVEHRGADDRFRCCPPASRMERRLNAPNIGGEVDRDVLDKIVAGDREALQELYATYHRRLARLLTRFIRRDDLIEEVINDTLWVVWRKASEFRGDSRLSTWIMGIAYRCALKTLRRRGHQSFHAVPFENEFLPAPDELDAAETGEWVALAMQQLPTEQRLTLELAYGQGHSCEEVAQIMDCPVNTVKSRMFQARTKLRTILPQLAGTACASRERPASQELG
jgi:RNA polymerase sigma-70 factor, ECF subfamily